MESVSRGVEANLDEPLQVWDFFQPGRVAAYHTALEDLDLECRGAPLLFWSCGERIVVLQP